MTLQDQEETPEQQEAGAGETGEALSSPRSGWRAGREEQHWATGGDGKRGLESWTSVCLGLYTLYGLECDP